MMRRKGQFGPDALVGMVIVALIGLGGIWFLNTYVNGLTIEGIISVLDQEIDQSCFYTMLPIIGDEYVREGHNVSAYADYTKMKNYFGGERHYASVSAEFEYKINFYTDKLSTASLGQKPTYIKGYLASDSKAKELEKQIFDLIDAEEWTLTKFCFIPIYNPAGGELGYADLMAAEDRNVCGVEGVQCCPGKICDPGLICNTVAGRELCRQS